MHTRPSASRARQYLRALRLELERLPAVRALNQMIWRAGTAKIPANFWEANHFFVVGCGHSGTSITLALLDRHSAIQAIQGESYLFFRATINRVRVLNRWYGQWSPTSVLAEKTPRHVYFTEAIRRAFPSSVIVGVTRDPLDTVASLKRRYRSLDIAVDRYLRDTTALLDAEAAGTVSTIVRYEDLVGSPEICVARVLELGNLSFEEGMLTGPAPRKTWYGGPTDRPVRYSSRSHDAYRNWQINQPLFDGRGRHREILGSREIEVVIRLTRQQGEALGYF